MDQIIEFRDRDDFRGWLKKNHGQKESIWIKLNKKDKDALKPGEALEEARCFGWIDSLIKRVDDTYYLKKFSKRREKSNWSEYNKKIIDRLIKDGNMEAPGLDAIKIAVENGSWDSPPQLPPVTENEMNELRNRLVDMGLEGAKFDMLTPSTKKNYAYFYLTAKMEKTRENRLAKIVDSIENGPFLF